MRMFLALLALTLTAASAFGVPDPRDSIILESKVVMTGFHPGSATDTGAYMRVRVWITNKDSLAIVTLPVEIRSTSGGAFIIVARPRSFNGTASRLTTTLKGTGPTVFAPKLNSISPDSAVWGTFADLSDPSDFEPPNSTRKPFWDIKFDTVETAFGTVEIDSIRINNSSVQFANSQTQIVPVNFLKSTIRVGLKGDMNLDGLLTPSDAVAHLNCVFLGIPPPAGGFSCDFNCDGGATPVDVILFWNVIFFGDPFPC